ncbi:protein ATP6V1FNB isoform X2 [Cricetulus griseus]|uniref:Protein ATP6V1FNB isoform X2 n=1 Tax=Cricetulus griseus TaxID=10029 RepID=A0A9J7KEA7_CRIGR|nr:protein ATP6V1FNB isoform X2 [Cricetulus griseus]
MRSRSRTWGGSSQPGSASATLPSPHRPRRGPGTHPEPLPLAVPQPPLPGRAVQLQQALQSLLLSARQRLLPAPGLGPRGPRGFGVPRASLLPGSTLEPRWGLLRPKGRYRGRGRSPRPFPGGHHPWQLGATTRGSWYPRLHMLGGRFSWGPAKVPGTALRVALFPAPHCRSSLSFPADF